MNGFRSYLDVHLGAAHYEMVADKILGLHLGDRVALGKDVYTVVGITSGMNSTGGDGMAFFSLLDSLAIQFDSSGEAYSTGAQRPTFESRSDRLW